jgi:hypothetical protein
MQMEQFVMIVMFFITPPALGKDRPWALQSTQSAEFNSWEACDDLIKNQLMPAIKSTDTVSLFGWCAPKDFNEARKTEFQRSLVAPGISSLERSKRITDRTKMKEIGSCYYYVPPPVPLKDAPTPDGTPVSQVAGTCAKSRP